MAALASPNDSPAAITGFSAVSPFRAALGCRCPRCGEGRLFSGLLKVRQACEVCGLDLSAQDAGDGPAVFVVFLLGIVVVGIAAWVELRFSPPIWVHLVVQIPVICLGAIVMLRPLKAVNLIHQKMAAMLEAKP